jgi:hypothetical protein
MALLEPQDLTDSLDAATAAVWNRARHIAGQDPFLVRADDFGNEIHRAAYNNPYSRYGWEKQHILPKSLGGTDDIWNLRPLHCRARASLGVATAVK